MLSAFSCCFRGKASSPECSTQATAESNLRKQLVQNLLAHLRQAQHAHDCRSLSLKNIEDQLYRLKATIDDLEANGHTQESDQVVSVKDRLSGLASRIEEAGATLEGSKSNQRDMVASVERALAQAPDQTLSHALMSCMLSHDKSRLTFHAVHDIYLQICDMCEEVGRTPVDVSAPTGASSLAEDTFECYMCMEKHSMEDMFCTMGCEHCCCRACAEAWAKAKLDDGQIPKCAAEGCSKPWVQEDFQVLDERLLHRYCAVEIHDYIGTLRCYKCLHCNMPVELPPGDQPMQPHVQCPLCRKESCLACETDWHEGYSCEQYQQRRKDQQVPDDEAFEQWLRDNRGRVHEKSAGGCGHAMLKEACNSVWCSACKYYFCWFCLQKIAEAGATTEEMHRHFGELESSCYGKCWEDPILEHSDLKFSA